MDIKNSEHYNDPTPHSAWMNICKEEQAEAARMKAIGALVSVIKQSSWTRTAGGFTDEHPKVRDVRAGHTKC